MKEDVEQKKINKRKQQKIKREQAAIKKLKREYKLALRGNSPTAAELEKELRLVLGDKWEGFRAQAGRNSERIIISLFDRQKDYGEIKRKGNTENSSAPSVEIARHQKTTNATRYILIHEPRYKEQAKSLIDDINSAMRKNRCSGADQHANHENQNVNRVTLCSTDYGEGGVWDISSATDAINKSLCKLKKGLMCSDFRLYVNLENGTVEQRTALALWAFQVTHERAKMTTLQDGDSPILRPVAECYFAKFPDENPGTAPSSRGMAGQERRLEFINADDPKKHFGLLQCKLNTPNARFKATLTQLEILLKRISIGLDDVILLTGPSGAGKTMIAKMCMKLMQCLHPDVTEKNCRQINMSAIPEELFEAELFGYEKGSFTGGLKDGKDGLVAQVNKGVLFLDEIGEMPLTLQAKLLTFLDNGEYRKMGGTEIEKSRFLLICGTNRDLENSIPTRFRRDLYERINMWHFDIPGLHERPDDIEPAIRRELAIWNDTRKTYLQFDPKALRKLIAHLKSIPLEGNYRELHSFVRRLLTLAQNSTITIDDVDREIQQSKPRAEQRSADKPTIVADSQLDYDLVDLAQLAAALDVCKTAKNGREAGELLFAATKGKSPTFNGSTYFQRIFEKFGLHAKFKDGKFDSVEQINRK